MPDHVRRIVRPPGDYHEPTLGEYVAVELASLGIREGEEFIIAHPDLLRVDKPQSAPHSNQTTSRKAALNVAPRAGSQRHRILVYVFHSYANGATREQIEHGLQLSGSTVRPRVRELLDGEFLIETERTRPTSAGNDALVLICSAKGELAVLDRAE